MFHCLRTAYANKMARTAARFKRKFNFLHNPEHKSNGAKQQFHKEHRISTITARVTYALTTAYSWSNASPGQEVRIVASRYQSPVSSIQKKNHWNL